MGNMGLQVQCTCMAKKSFTTRLDEDVLALAQRLAEEERRSVTAILELAVIEYGAKRSKASDAVPRQIGPEDEARGGREASED